MIFHRNILQKPPNFQICSRHLYDQRTPSQGRAQEALFRKAKTSEKEPLALCPDDNPLEHDHLRERRVQNT